MKLILLLCALVAVAAAVDDLTFKFLFTYKGQETDVKYQLFELDENTKKTLTKQLSTSTESDNDVKVSLDGDGPYDYFYEPAIDVEFLTPDTKELKKVSLDGDGPYDYFYEPAIDVEFLTPDTKELKKGRLIFEPKLFKVGKNTQVGFTFDLNVLKENNLVHPSKIVYH